MTDEPDDLEDPTPPAPDRVARRALVFAALACRSAIERDAADPAAGAFHREVLAWLDGVGAAAEAEPGELAVLRVPLGGVPRQADVDASWRGEALAVLAWALGRAELPPYDAAAEAAAVADALGFRTDAAAELVRGARLRPAEEIDALAARQFAVHWRVREFSLRRAPLDFATFARTAWFGPLDVAGLAFAEGDLAVGGAPLSRAPEARWRECLSIARERHQAANWLRGDDPVYSEVTADT